jgi:hypothetical protein
LWSHELQNCYTNRLCGRGGVIGPRIKVNQNLGEMDRRCTVWDNEMDISTVLLSTLKMHTEGSFKTSVTNKTNGSNNLNDHNLNMSRNL